MARTWFVQSEKVSLLHYESSVEQEQFLSVLDGEILSVSLL